MISVLPNKDTEMTEETKATYGAPAGASDSKRFVVSGPKRTGRIALDGAENTKRYLVSLDSETVERAKKLGDGNLSLGLRKAVKAV